MDSEEVVKVERKESSSWELVRFAILALIIVLPVRFFVAQPFIVSGSSMVPTFENHDYLIIDKLSYEISNPKRDDVIVFRYPGDKDLKTFFIKRIIGLPGETVNIEGSVVTIFNKEHPEGLVLDQPYVKNISKNKMSFELESDEYFVMGDNRVASSDSRYWGAVKRKLIIGRAYLRLWPLSGVDILPGNYSQKE